MDKFDKHELSPTDHGRELWDFFFREEPIDIAIQNKLILAPQVENQSSHLRVHYTFRHRSVQIYLFRFGQFLKVFSFVTDTKLWWI